MIPLIGAYYRFFRRAAAVDRLRAMAPDAQRTVEQAAHLLGMRPAGLYALARCYAPGPVRTGSPMSATALRRMLRNARTARYRA